MCRSSFGQGDGIEVKVADNIWLNASNFLSDMLYCQLLIMSDSTEYMTIVEIGALASLLFVHLSKTNMSYIVGNVELYNSTIVCEYQTV